MSEAFTDEELLSAIRQRAFEALLFTVALEDGCPIKHGLTGTFNLVLNSVDELTKMMSGSGRDDAPQP
jgi:hypothetical protein